MLNILPRTGGHVRRAVMVLAVCPKRLPEIRAAVFESWDLDPGIRIFQVHFKSNLMLVGEVASLCSSSRLVSALEESLW